MKTSPNPQSTAEEFASFLSKTNSPFQGANITIENLTIHMSVEPAPGKEGSTEEIFSLKQTPTSEGVKVTILDEPESNGLDVADLVMQIKEDPVVSEPDNAMMRELENPFTLKVYAIGDNGRMYLPDTDKKSFTLGKIKEFERGTIIVGETQSYHESHVIKNRWQKVNEGHWKRLAAVTEKSSLERAGFEPNGSMESDSNQVSSLNVLASINYLLELTKKFPERYPFEIKAINSKVEVIAHHTLDSKGYLVDKPEHTQMLDRLDNFSIGTRVVFTNKHGAAPTAIVKTWVKIGQDNWYVMPGFDAYEHLRAHSANNKEPKETRHTASKPSVTENSEQQKGESSGEVAKEVVGLNPSDILVFSPSGEVLYEVDVEEWFDRLVVSMITGKLDDYEVGTRFSVIFNSCSESFESGQWVKTAESTWTPVLPVSQVDSEAVGMYMLRKRDHAQDTTQVKEKPVASESIQAMVDKIESFTMAEVIARTPTGRKYSPDDSDTSLCFSLQELDAFEPGTKVTADVFYETINQEVKFRWEKLSQDHWHRLSDIIMELSVLPQAVKTNPEPLSQSKLEGFKVVTAEEVVRQVTSGLGIVFAAKANEAHSSQVCTCKQFNEQRALALSPGTIVASASHLDAPQPDSDVIWLKGSSLYWIRMPRSAVPFPVCQAS